MPEMSHRLVIFLTGTIKKKMPEKARFADSTYGARLFRHEKVAEARPSARLGASTDPTKKSHRTGIAAGRWARAFCSFRDANRELMAGP